VQIEAVPVLVVDEKVRVEEGLPVAVGGGENRVAPSRASAGSLSRGEHRAEYRVAGRAGNRRLLRRLQQIDGLPKRDQDALLRTIDAFLSKAG